MVVSIILIHSRFHTIFSVFFTLFGLWEILKPPGQAGPRLACGIPEWTAVLMSFASQSTRTLRWVNGYCPLAINHSTFLYQHCILFEKISTVIGKCLAQVSVPYYVNHPLCGYWAMIIVRHHMATWQIAIGSCKHDISMCICRQQIHAPMHTVCVFGPWVEWKGWVSWMVSCRSGEHFLWPVLWYFLALHLPDGPWCSPMQSAIHLPRSWPQGMGCLGIDTHMHKSCDI